MMAITVMAASCGGDDPVPAPEPDPQPTPGPTPEPEPDPIDPNALYNGIVLPSQWPLQRNYASEIRSA